MASARESIAELGLQRGKMLATEHQRTTASAMLFAAVPGLVEVAMVVATSLNLVEFGSF